MRVRVRILPVIAAASVLLAACGTAAAPQMVEPQGNAPDAAIAEGRLVPADYLEHSFAVGGVVAEILAAEGDPIAVGQVLARLETSPEASAALAQAERETLAADEALDALQSGAELALAQARVALLDAQKEADRAEERFDATEDERDEAKLAEAEARLRLAEDTLKALESGGGVDPEALAAAEARRKAARATQAAAQAAVDAGELRAQLSGTVTDLAIRQGQRVGATQPVLTIADLSRWQVVTQTLTELDVVRVRIGERASIMLDALPDRSFSGVVVSIRERFVELRGDITYTVVLELDQDDPHMRWGMTAAVRFLP